MFGNIGPWELVFILAIALMVVGPGKLPEVARSLGKATNEFKKVTTGMKKELENAMRDTEETLLTNPSSIIDKETAKGEAHTDESLNDTEENRTETKADSGSDEKIPVDKPKSTN
jgi:sec-independent protein translocase protein TatA